MRIVSYIILGIIILVFFTHLNFYSTHIDLIDYPLRAFYHANIAHLAANAISFYSLSFLENAMGSAQFLLAMVFIWIFSSIILYAIHKIFPSRKKYTVGFSGVIFGLIVIYFFLLNKSAGITTIGLIISILPQILAPGISFEGHLSGIIAGFLYVLFFHKKLIKFDIKSYLK
ncbi:MAG: putative rhomboid protein [Satyrvirus sp.]|uniref:Putative rhomboid protein n=1 Tax=Satyrvirus sp. TaxID=2487771 RepID=A0A3G5AE84_9VIRU|nr:MAG: putative rhomboid protein [Satyrvirus sp.]